MSLGLSYRKMQWVIAASLTLSTVLNLIDRQTLSILAPFLRDKFQLSQLTYSHIVTGFLLSYTVMYTVGGAFVDWIWRKDRDGGVYSLVVHLNHADQPGAGSVEFRNLSFPAWTWRTGKLSCRSSGHDALVS